jgi:tetraacyldisaccharide 4'-kinase
MMAAALMPLSALYARVAAARSARVVPYRSKLPVICIGNFTAGGAGKTPTAMAVAELLKGLGAKPAFLTRGYGGTTQGPHRVREGDGAEDVGDEPLLLAKHAPTYVAADRAAGARAIEVDGHRVIVMDDGFQNPGLAKDLSLIVVDAATGAGNGLVIPAGPLRAPLGEQASGADALVVVGEGNKAAALVHDFAARGKPMLKASVKAKGDTRWLTVLPVIGFTGIARPQKFFATLEQNGARLIEARAFHDHHRFSERQARKLLQDAREKKAMLVTTEKDWMRLPEERETPLGELQFRSRPLPIAVVFEDEAKLKDLLQAAIRKKG